MSYYYFDSNETDEDIGIVYRSDHQNNHKENHRRAKSNERNDFSHICSIGINLL